jgi:hypothetical protein
MPIYLWLLAHARLYKLSEQQTNWHLLQPEFFIGRPNIFIKPAISKIPQGPFRTGASSFRCISQLANLTNLFLSAVFARLAEVYVREFRFFYIALR